MEAKPQPGSSAEPPPLPHTPSPCPSRTEKLQRLSSPCPLISQPPLHAPCHFRRFPTTKRFTAAVEILNGLDAKALAKILARLLKALPDKGAGSFSDDEREQMRALFELTEPQIDLLLGSCAFIFEQAAYATTPPENLRTELEGAPSGGGERDARRELEGAFNRPPRRFGHPVVVEAVAATLKTVGAPEAELDRLVKGRAVCTEAFQALKVPCPGSPCMQGGC